MISFRYHIVSLIAVFLALAGGIAIGTTALNGPITNDLRRQIGTLRAQRHTLRAHEQKLSGEVDAATQFATTFGARLVSGSLAKKKVLLLSMPGVSSAMTNGIAEQLNAAGASISGRLALSNAYVDPSQGDSLASLATGTHPLGLTLPTTADGRVVGASLLSFVLVGKGKASDVSSVLSGLAHLQMLDSDPAHLKPAPNVVVVGSGSLRAQAYAGQAGYDLVAALISDGAHVVVAGDHASAYRNGLIALTRGGSAKAEVSTVDNADTPYGQVSTALALANAISSDTGQYGTARGAQALFPTADK